MSGDSPLMDLPGRGKHEASPLGTTVFIIARALDPFLQYNILAGAWTPLTTILPKLGLIPPIAPSNYPVSFTGLGTAQSILFFMSIGSSVKQIFNCLFIAKERMFPVLLPISLTLIFVLIHSAYYPGFSLMVAAFNTVLNALNAFVFLSSPPLQLSSRLQLSLAIPVYTLGILAETTAETQRRRFKDRPENAGKAYTGGLFGLARHINYGGYTLWRGAYALASGGPVWAAAVAGFFSQDFANRAVPVLDQYCEGRYGEQWRRFRQDVPWKLLPWLY